jgi:HSP20 family protein
MTQQKKSFFEKLTGIKRVDENGEEEFVINPDNQTMPQSTDSDGFAPASFEINDETYEVPNNNLQPEEPMQNFAPIQTEEPVEEIIEEPIEEPVAQTPAPVADKPATSVVIDNEDEGGDSEGQLTIDVYQTDDEVIIKSTIAGVKPEDLDVSINNDMVTIKGERKQEDEISLDNYYYQECYWGLFSRSVILPVEIIADKAEATMKNGILTLKLPKADTTKTRKIQVRGF